MMNKKILILLLFPIWAFAQNDTIKSNKDNWTESDFSFKKERIKQRVESGLSAARELSRAEAREAEAFAKLTSVRQNLGIAISKFRIYFPTGDLPTKIPFHPNNFSNVSLLVSQDIMLSRNPLVLQANEQLRASKFRTKNVNASALPRLDLELKKQHYNVTQETDEFDFYSGVNFTYDIYTGGRNEA